MTKKYKTASKNYKIFIKGKLYRTCKSEKEKDSIMTKLKKDKTIKDGDITIGLNILVSKV